MNESDTSQEVQTIPAHRIFSPVDGRVVPRPPPAPREFDWSTYGPWHNLLRIYGGAAVVVAGAILVFGTIALIRDGAESLGQVLQFVAWIVAPAASGCLAFSIGSREGQRRRRIYQDGIATVAVLSGIRWFTVPTGGLPSYYEVKWKYSVDGVDYHGKCTTDRKLKKKHGRVYLWVFYDPENPKDSVEWPPMS